jgi:tetratricopeptide (TPR) repeat protein
MAARRGVAALVSLVPLVQVVALMLSARSAAAQRRQAPEFTQQGILVTNFWVAGKETPSFAKADMRFGRKAGDAVRDRLAHLVNKREARVIDGRDVRESLILSSLSVDTVLSIADLRPHGEYFRADEAVLGLVTRSANTITLEANLVLLRDPRMRQPILPVTSNDLDRAAEQLALRLNDARLQLKFQRRCENFLRLGEGARAIQAARDGIAANNRAALARTCLVTALRATGAPAADVLQEAQGVLAIDREAFHALEAAAEALDTLRRRDEAAEMWLRLAATDSTNLELIERVVWSMAEGSNSRHAEPLIVRVSDRYPDDLRLMRQKWRVANDNRHWPLAVASGEKLLAMDSTARADSLFFLRLATAYRANGQMFKAVETVARGVATFPKDARLYALYTQFVKEEADTVISRGIALYPNSAELLALSAKDLRSKGKVAEALDASKKAVELDSTIAQGRLMVAQAEIDLGRPDSALVTLRHAVVAGEDRNAVAQFALSKGNVLFRAANGTKTRADFQLAMRFLAFSDSLKSTPQTKFLLGAAALSVAQTALTDAPNIKLKEESCVMSHLGADTIPLARASLEAGQDVSPEATKQFLEYLDQISPYADKQIAAFCVTGAPQSMKKTPGR